MESLEQTEPSLTSSTEEPEPTAAPPEKLTRKQLGQLRRQYLTITHGTVKACEHKARFSRDHDPKSNCVDCWSAYLETSVDLEFVHTILTTKGVAELTKIKGKKFVRMFHGWLSSNLLPALKAEVEEKPKEETVHIEGSTFDNASQKAV
jgi:hypothetical protein